MKQAIVSEHNQGDLNVLKSQANHSLADVEWFLVFVEGKG